ncbi:hypothetical protein ACIBCM_02140 [Streptomyces sp. NPDC051018]|uniref:hypothetical protein n=1 Tax=Streptomyces sp. NPDC051018 TaxID=3365639 RepID=UPI00379B8F62
MTNSPAYRASRDREFTLTQLRGDRARMAAHRPAPLSAVPAAVPPSRIRGVVVPAAPARIVASMSDDGSGFGHGSGCGYGCGG